MRLIIDSVFRSIYSKVLEARPDVQKEIGGLDQLKAQRLTMDVFPCYRSIINKISDSCFSMPRVSMVSIYIYMRWKKKINRYRYKNICHRACRVNYTFDLKITFAMPLIFTFRWCTQLFIDYRIPTHWTRWQFSPTCVSSTNKYTRW